MSTPTASDTKARMIQNKHQPKSPLPPTSVLHSPEVSGPTQPCSYRPVSFGSGGASCLSVITAHLRINRCSLRWEQLLSWHPAPF